MTTFSSIRSQIINLEKQIDKSLIKLSNYEKTVSTNEDQEFEATIKSQIQSSLDETNTLISKLSRINEFENLSTSKLQQLTRHKEIMFDHSQHFNKLINGIDELKNRNNLLFSIRSDLNKRQQLQSSDQHHQNNEQDANDYILQESVRVTDFNSFANRLLQSAYETRDELINQRNYLSNANFNLGNLIQQIPGLNVLISKINTRRKRDTLILATVISVCLILLFFV